MESTFKGYSLSINGDDFISLHFQVKEFKRYEKNDRGAMVLMPDVVVSSDLIVKLERLSDCINNKAVYIDKTYGPERVVIRGKNYLAEDLALLAQACGFSYVRVTGKYTVDVSVDESLTLNKDFISDCDWLHIRIVPFEWIDHIRVMETRESVKTTAAKFDEYDIGTNGTFFCTYKEPQFNLKINGLTLKSYYNHKWGMIFTKDRIRYGELSQGNTFISGHPILLDNGRFCDYTYAAGIDGERARTAWGYDDNNIYILVCEADRGLTFRGLRQVMSYIGAKYAINLDGGGSASLFEKGKVVNLQGDQRKVNNCILIKFKKEL